MKKISLMSMLSLAALLLICLQSIGQTTFNYTGAVQTYAVPAGVTSLQISASGAQGGNNNETSSCYGFFFSDFHSGGLGANMSGVFAVTPGHVLNILVGAQGQVACTAPGGGGGTFVWDVTAGNVLLIAAGGGGGACVSYFGGGGPGGNAVITINGTDGQFGPGGGGAGGNGGAVPVNNGYGGGGTGWLSNGAHGIASGCASAGGGQTPLSGGAGGAWAGTVNFDGNGGFGGGGGGQGWCNIAGSGGGGGYSGGGGGAAPSSGGPFGAGGGGGSYNIGASQVNTVGNSGNGQVVLTPISAATPTLSEWGLITFTLLLLSFGMVFVYRKQNALAMAGAMTEDEKPSTFDRSLYFKALGGVMVLAVAGLVTAYRYFGTLTLTDTLGTLVSACIVAYMVQLSMLMKKK